jgi:hypothetical protein
MSRVGYIRVEFAAFIDKTSARVAAHAERSHKTHSLELRTGLLWTSGACDFRRVKIGGIIFGENLPFRHCGEL